MSKERGHPIFVGVLTAALCFWMFQGTTAKASEITFSEMIYSTATDAGFNGFTNEFLYSSDGYYRYEAFSLGADGVFDIENVSGNDVLKLGQGSGYRITRMGGTPMNLFYLDLFGQVAVGQLDLSDALNHGNWDLFEETSGSQGNPTRVNFGNQFTNLIEIFVADPSFAGGTSTVNYVDNTFANLPLPPPVEAPEPSTFILAALSLLSLGMTRRRRRR